VVTSLATLLRQYRWGRRTHALAPAHWPAHHPIVHPLPSRSPSVFQLCLRAIVVDCAARGVLSTCPRPLVRAAAPQVSACEFRAACCAAPQTRRTPYGVYRLRSSLRTTALGERGADVRPPCFAVCAGVSHPAPLQCELQCRLSCVQLRRAHERETPQDTSKRADSP